MEKDFFKEKYLITDLLFSTNMTKTQIAKEIEITVPELNKRIKSYGLGWVGAKKRKMSRGQAAIVDILKKILPNETIEFEHHIGERLLVDIYIPSYKLGIEYHGRQHFFYSAFFYKSEVDFKLAQERDERKVQLCKENGLSLVVFRYNDNLDEDIVFDRMLQAIKNQPVILQKERKLTEHEKEFVQIKKDLIQRTKKHRASLQKEIKARRDNDDEYKRRQEAFKKSIKEKRRQQRRDDYNNVGNRIF